jgi:hypothetical protein
VTHHHQTIRSVELMGVAAAIEIDVVPIPRLKVMEGMPEQEFVVIAHRAPRASLSRLF